MSMWICQDRYCLQETPCRSLTLPMHFMHLILIPNQMCTTSAHMETHMDLKVIELTIWGKKTTVHMELELLNKKYIKLHKSSLFIYRISFLFLTVAITPQTFQYIALMKEIY